MNDKQYKHHEDTAPDKIKYSPKSSVSLYFSVVICTYNRADLLRTCIESLLAMRPNPGGFEIIVVDNNSSDHTRQTVEDLSEIAEQLLYVREENQGLSNARNRGVMESAGKYIAFIDDECIVPNDWLLNAEKLCTSITPDVAGGHVNPWFIENTRPKWFLDTYASTGGYLRREGMDSTELHNVSVSGCNMFIHNTVFERVGLFDTTLGMTGSKINYGEETEFQMRARAHPHGAKIWLDPNISLQHLVRREKMQLVWLFRDFVKRGRNYQLLSRENGNSAFHVFLDLLITTFDVATDVLVWRFVRNRGLYRRPQNYIFEVTCRKRAFKIGMQLHRLGW